MVAQRFDAPSVEGFDATVARRQIYLTYFVCTFGGEKSVKLAKRTFEKERKK